MIIGIGGHIYPLPPSGYGGVERVASWWVEELKNRGYPVYIIGNDKSTVLNDGIIPNYGSDSFDESFQLARKHLGVEIIHDNNDIKPNPIRWAGPYIYTVHACCWNGNPNPVFLSYNQARWFNYNGIPKVNHNGFFVDRYAWSDQKEDFFLWCGALRGIKEPHMAIQVCEETGEKLKIIGCIQDDKYLDFPEKYPIGGQIEYLGEMGEGRMEYFRKAKGFLYTCDRSWMEGYNLTNDEALLSGTPVIGIRTQVNRILDEQIVHGESGFICEGYDEMKMVIKDGWYKHISPEACRKQGEKHNVKDTVDRYLEFYKLAISGFRW